MTMFLAPYTAIADIDGSPLDAGFIYFGEYGKNPESFPVPVFWDADFTVPAAQPIRTRNGYPVRNGSPAKVYLKTAQHSIVIKNRNNAFILVDFENKGWNASLIADASGKNQQEINNNTAFFYQTTAEMLADKKLADGMIVGTKGYHNVFDDGGATYLISSVATDYSIPLANGLHAVFRDTFDIRKFGIRDSETLDQTAELQRMVAYADSRFYEIDFHNFSIMTPDITHFTTPRGSVVKGLGFHYPHHLKNIKPANDKSKTLQQGTCQILFLPKSKGVGVFKFSNAEFDSYVPNFNIISGEYDGMMCGFMVMPHPDWADFNILEESGYDFDVADVRFKSPAISYNISLAGIQANQTRLSRLTGEYWGLYVNIFTKILDADDSVAVFRDDLHNGSGRLLVTNFIHEEPEITGATVVQEKYSIKNCKCFKKSNGAPYTVYKLHALAKTTIKEFNFINCVGILDFYTALDSLTQQSIIQTLNISDIDQLLVSLRSTIGTLNLKNVKETASYVINGNYIGVINITGGIKLTFPLGLASGVVESLNFDSVDVINQTYGLVRSTVITIDNINIGKLTLNSNKLIECKFKTIDISDFDFQFAGDLNNAILCRDASVNPLVKIRNFSSLSSNLQYFMLFDPAHIGSVIFLNCKFLSVPYVENGSIQYVMSSVSATKAFAPPSINGGASAITTIPLAGAKVGDIINANFSQFNSNIIVSAYVDTPDIVKVELKNISNNTISLASGALSIKLV